MVEWWNGGREPNVCEGWNRVVEAMKRGGELSQEKEGSGTLLVLRIYSLVTSRSWKVKSSQVKSRKWIERVRVHRYSTHGCYRLRAPQT